MWVPPTAHLAVAQMGDGDTEALAEKRCSIIMYEPG